MWVDRELKPQLVQRLRANAGVVLLGPRQVGKTSLARDVADGWPERSVYLDLERPADRNRLADADAYLRAQAPKLTVIDEAQRAPELFEVLRGVIDDRRREGHATGQFLLLGSASLDLIRLTESLAGRVSHLELTGVAADEAAAQGIDGDQLWVRGGYPDSLLASDDETSVQWREDLIRSYLEREVPMFAPRIPAARLRRLWTMLAHSTGGLLNATRLAEGLATSGPTVDRYIDLLADLGLVRRLLPWHTNVGKRITKAPKVHVRDSGLIHALLGLTSLDDVLSHPVAGPSWESHVIENAITAAPGYDAHHYRTARGDEVDLVLVRGGVPQIAIEVKRSTSPTIEAGTRRAIEDLGVAEAYVVHPETQGEPYSSGGVQVVGLTTLLRRLRP